MTISGRGEISRYGRASKMLDKRLRKIYHNDIYHHELSSFIMARSIKKAIRISGYIHKQADVKRWKRPPDPGPWEKGLPGDDTSWCLIRETSLATDRARAVACPAIPRMTVRTSPRIPKIRDMGGWTGTPPMM
jgi:hypothetical protein